GYHTEYGGFRFVLFFLGEYIHVVTISFLTIILFFGGWQFPLIATPESAYTGAWLVKVGVLLAKVGAVILVIMLIRWTIPRFRFDQLMGLTWKVLIPLSLANLLCVTVVLELDRSRWLGLNWSRWLLLPISLALLVGAGAITLRRPTPPRPRRAVAGREAAE